MAKLSGYSPLLTSTPGNASRFQLTVASLREDVIGELFYLFVSRGSPEHIRSDNGPEFTARAIRSWLNRLGVKTLFIERGSPWENGYIESFNGKLRDELLNREIFTTLTEAKILIEQWRKEYNQIRPHSTLDYQPPAPKAIMPVTLTQKVVQLMGAGQFILDVRDWNVFLFRSVMSNDLYVNLLLLNTIPLIVPQRSMHPPPIAVSSHFYFLAVPLTLSLFENKLSYLNFSIKEKK